MDGLTILVLGVCVFLSFISGLALAAGTFAVVKRGERS